MPMDAGFETVRVLTLDETCPVLPLIEGQGRAVALIWPGTGAAHRSMHHFDMAAGDATVSQCHPGEAAYYIKSGTGVVMDPADGVAQPLIEGSMVHVGPNTAYRFVAGDDGMVMLGGPCPPDPALYAHL
ncbi:hypothetical protein ACQW02_19105 [Humitalea sp. 24SJ18S-53]|uniref:hypothetical protein n=1 Tax=Humitalea sp. 24SJ18S-53 TaxID=3422307 RepID=UPI003D666839